MSGGRLVVVDRAGRDVKRFPLDAGLATLGAAPACDIRVLLPAVRPHHATVAVHHAQTVIRNVGDGETLVNGQSISVAALRHGDIITLGDRSLRWEYSAPNKRQLVSAAGGPPPALALPGAGRARGRRRGSAGGGPPPRDQGLRRALEMAHRASMPASSGGKQVAIVQPQRRDASEQTGTSPGARPSQAQPKRRSKTDLDCSPTSTSTDSDSDKRKTRVSPKTVPANTTKATLWIESRKGRGGRRAGSARARTPLRLAVLRRAQSAHKMKVVKIEAPLTIDHTKQAAIMLMAGHTPRSRLACKGSPSFVPQKRGPAGATPARSAGTFKKMTRSEITEPTRAGSVATRASKSPRRSPPLPSPKKSALKDLTKKGNRKTESIKFDLSNLEGPRETEITSGLGSEDGGDDEDLTLRYSESSGGTPSPRLAHSSRGSRMLQSLGSPGGPPATLSSLASPGSPGSRRSARSARMVSRALDGSERSVASAFRTRTLSPRARDLESFSVIDLGSIDSDASRSAYASAASADCTAYGTPAAPRLLGCSTPYLRAGRARSLATPEGSRPRSASDPRLSRARRSRSRLNDSDLMLLDDSELDDSSPKTSRRTRTKSNVDDSKVAPAKDGPGTPESRRSPVEVGTPVLSIRSLLDSSRSSLRPRSSERQRRNPTRPEGTAGVGSGPRRRLDSDRTDPGAPRDDDETVTPKSAVKPVPEAVKNKHSTAKKPQSKRSMIDDLNRSDIVKQLFNSPVKRKLSQSMTEFSRRQLFEDDEAELPKRPTRRTIALTGRSVDDLSDRSGTFTPERFVSPISTPSHSPNLSGIKRLFQKSTPENDLTDVRGVRSLLRTHRTRRSAKNDLSNVTGLKIVFADSPENRLSDVRAKEAFKPLPNDDLRRVSGVKALFQQRSPRNDLSDVRGVKKLFRKSPNNDLRNLSGVKRTLRNSPRNDLSDVRGVRRMFRNNRNERSLPDVSGIEELFDTSAPSNRTSDSLFDRLVGKPPVKAVYSKTFSAKLIQKPKPKTRKAKSLASSSPVMTDNVEEWLERELQKRFRREEPSTFEAGNHSGNNSRNHSRNLPKELNNLATSTVAGGEPLRASRTRNSSMMKRSASDIYGAHTLPIKKRSLGAAAPVPPPLPLKKRALAHSTPRKGAPPAHAGPVSPIAPLAPLEPQDRSSRRKVILEEPENGGPKAETALKSPTGLGAGRSAGPRAGPGPISEVASPAASPEKVKRSPPKRVPRNRKNPPSDNNPPKRRPSLVISKRAPAMSPQIDPIESVEAQDGNRKRIPRGQKQQKETPKRTRIKPQKATVVVSKPSPKLKPQAEIEEPQLEGRTRRTRKNTAAEVDPESPKKSQPRATRGKRSAPQGKENKTDNVERPKRGRHPPAAEVEPPVMKRRRGNEQIVQEVKTRGKSVIKADSKPDEKQPKTRAKKVEVLVSVQPEPPTRRGRKKAENVSLESQPKTRGKKVNSPAENEPKMRGKKVESQLSVQSEPPARARRTKAAENSVLPPTTGRKRKTAAVEEVPAKITRTTRRGKNVDPVETETKIVAKSTVKTRAAKDKSESKEETKTRGRTKKAESAKEAPAPAKTTRGRKAAEPKEILEADKRKRKTKVEASPAKGKKQSPANNKAARSRPVRAASTARR